MKNWKVIKTAVEYKTALQRTIDLFETADTSGLSDELDLLLVLIKDYEDKNVQLPTITPIEVIKLKMEELGIKVKDLEPVIGSKGHVSSILSGRRELTLKMANKLKNYFNLPADIFLPEKLS